MEVESWAGSHVGLVREANEDSVGCFQDLGLFVVCDGLGGHDSGEVASRIAVDAVRECVAKIVQPGTTNALLERTRRLLGRPQATRDEEDLLREAVENANRRVLSAAAELDDGQSSPTAEGEEGRSMATTVVALKLDLADRRLAWAHVGDSRLYRLRGGVLELLTADHTVAGSRYLDGSEIPTDLPHSNRLLQALGIEPTIDVVTRADPATAGDVLLLCSDGLSGLVPAGLIRDTLAISAPLHEVGEKLIQLALDAGGKDNTSAVLVRLSAE